MQKAKQGNPRYHSIINKIRREARVSETLSQIVPQGEEARVS
jgi:hypothetical protein